jgi:hypothetical protein
MRLQNPRTIALLTAGLALFTAGLVWAAYAAGWPTRTMPPMVLIAPS